MELALQTVANSMILFAFFCILAVGLSLAFGVMGTANYAHGEFYMIGAYTVWLLYTLNHWPFFATVLIAIGIVALIGMLAELALFRRARGNVIAGLLLAIGLSFILSTLVARIWGVGIPKPVTPPLKGALELLGVAVGWQRVAVAPVAAATLVGLFVFLHRTRQGRALRAVAEDREAASLQGISANKSALLALGVASAMAGLAGAMLAPIMPVIPYMGHWIIWMCFIIIIVGGAGNLKGTILACLILAFISTVVTTLVDSTVGTIVSSVFMLIFLAFRPEGLFGNA